MELTMFFFVNRIYGKTLKTDGLNVAQQMNAVYIFGNSNGD